MSPTSGRQGYAYFVRLYGRASRHGVVPGRREQHPERGRRPEFVLTQRLFPKFSELQLCEDGANATFRHRDAVDEAARASARRMRELSLDTGTAPRRWTPS